MATAHRERLGLELIRICQGVKERVNYDESGVLVRLEGLLDAGADPNGRGLSGNTPLQLLIQSGNVRLASTLLHCDASVTCVNEEGFTAVDMAAQLATKLRLSGALSPSSHEEWREFIQELKRREATEKAREEARNRERSEANEEHRERQRTLAAEARASNNNTPNQRGLGRLEDGIGYFPSLATLQFQSSIPGPSPSLAEYENSEKERLNRILKSIGLIVFMYLLLS